MNQDLLLTWEKEKTLNNGCFYIRLEQKTAINKLHRVCPLFTNLGRVETHFSNVRFRGDDERADNVYKGITPLTGADIADVAFYAASAPKHVQIAEVLILATHQANGSVIYRKK